MSKLILTNKTVSGGLWVDIRFSNGGLPFSELPIVPGFPKLMQYGQPVSIDIGDWSELLYRRENVSFEGAMSEVRYLPSVYRVKAPMIDCDLEAEIECSYD